MTPELEKKIEDAADADFIVGKTRPIGTRERYLYEEKRESFLNGVSFGRKGMYTEAEVLSLLKRVGKEITYPETYYEPSDTDENNDKYFNSEVEDWFEQNKKKEE